MVLLCAGLQTFRCLGKFQENSQKIHGNFYQPEMEPEGSQGAPGGLLARPPPWPRREAAWGGPTPSGALPVPLFLPVTEKAQNGSPFSDLRRGAAATLCSSLGELIWRLFWPPVRGNHRHRHHHRLSIIPP